MSSKMDMDVVDFINKKNRNDLEIDYEDDEERQFINAKEASVPIHDNRIYSYKDCYCLGRESK